MLLGQASATQKSSKPNFKRKNSKIKTENLPVSQPMAVDKWNPFWPNTIRAVCLWRSTAEHCLHPRNHSLETLKYHPVAVSPILWHRHSKSNLHWMFGAGNWMILLPSPDTHRHDGNSYDVDERNMMTMIPMSWNTMWQRHWSHSSTAVDNGPDNSRAPTQ